MAKASSRHASTSGVLVDSLDYAFDKRSWHGPNLMGALRGVTPATAAARVHGRKSIWEQLLHSAYWKHRVLKALLGDAQPPLGRKGANWPAPPADATEAAWRADLQLLHQLHAKLRAHVTTLSPKQLDKKSVWLIHGAAAHDLYHAGQIKLLRRLVDEGRPPS